MSKQSEAETQPDIPTLAPDDTCNARKRLKKGQATPKNPYCSRPAGWGTDHLGIGRCKLHGGNVPNHRQAAQTELAKRGVEAFGLPLNIEPHEALLQELHRTAGIVEFYQQQINALETEANMVGPVGTSGTARDTDLEHTPKAEANIWIRLHKEEREHLVRVAKTCIDAGIQERQVQIAEAQGALFANAIRGLLSALEINLTSPRVRQAVRQALMDISNQQAIPSTAKEIGNGA